MKWGWSYQPLNLWPVLKRERSSGGLFPQTCCLANSLQLVSDVCRLGVWRPVPLTLSVNNSRYLSFTISRPGPTGFLWLTLLIGHLKSTVLFLTFLRSDNVPIWPGVGSNLVKVNHDNSVFCSPFNLWVSMWSSSGHWALNRFLLGVMYSGEVSVFLIRGYI